MEHEWRNALIKDLNEDELRTLFWKVYEKMCYKHEEDMDKIVARTLLEVTET